MAETQHRSQRKLSGGRYHSARSKKSSELVGFAAKTKVADRKMKTKRQIGGSTKEALLSANEVSVSDKKGKTQKTQIINVLENPANPNLVRRNILTKGAIVETKLGKVRITSRPGQESTVNGVLL